MPINRILIFYITFEKDFLFLDRYEKLIKIMLFYSVNQGNDAKKYKLSLCN